MSGRTLPADIGAIGASPIAEATREIWRRGRNPALALAVIVACQLMLILDGTIVNIALPNIQRSLNFSATDLAWVINAYALAFGGLLLLGGRAGDILGRRRMFVAGIVVFTAASLLGGFATSSEWLLASRAAQGLGAAMSAPSALALVLSTFPEGSGRTRALSIFSAVSAFGASLGLIAGGLLTSFASWRWVMFVNVPIGIAIVLLAPRFITESERQTGRFDVLGALTGTVGSVSLVYGFIRASSYGWSDVSTIAAFAAAVILLALFVFVERRASQPIMPLRLFADRNRASGYVNMLLIPAAAFGTFFFLTQFVQNVLGFSPVMAGLAFLPLSLTILTFSQLVPRLLPRFGAKLLLVTGGVMITAGMVWLTQISAATSYLSGLLGPMLLLGVGFGLSFTPLTIVILSGVPGSDSGAASGLLQTMQQVGGSLGVAMLVTQFGTATRNASTEATTALQAREIAANGIASSFTVAAAIAAVALLVALFAISANVRRAAAPDDEGKEPEIPHALAA
ncbi:MAG: MFS transporter [Chloroflexia bacterium]|nr:MFS transporter [Chloroflexia bacterium]